MEYKVTESSLGQLLRDIYVKYADSMPRGMAFNLLLPPDDIRITTDFIRLRQVVEHLVGNAAKFTAEGHIDLGYLVERRRERGYSSPTPDAALHPTRPKRYSSAFTGG